MPINNWSYEEVNQLLEELTTQKDSIKEIEDIITNGTNSLDVRVKNYLENMYNISNMKEILERANESIENYYVKLKDTNERAKEVEEDNYNSILVLKERGKNTIEQLKNKTIQSQEKKSTGNRENISSNTNNNEITTNSINHEEEKLIGVTTVGVATGIGNTITQTETQQEETTEIETTQNTEAPTETETEPLKEEDEKINGATGFSASNGQKYLKTEPSNKATSIVALTWGEPFRIISSNEDDTWWKVEYNGQTGYVENKHCLINLPDFIPNIEYNITNAQASIFQSSNEPLSVYGQQLYTSGKVYNERLGRNEYIVPLAYGFAKKILAAQLAAQSAGYNLKIYDAYRPKSVAVNVRDSLQSLYNSNPTVKKNIDISPKNGSIWGTGWFIASNLSAHSVASAIDVTMVNNATKEEIASPSAMHELSTQAVKYIYGVKGQTKVQENLYTEDLGEECKLLDKIMLNAGLTNLASEWWHFQDNNSYNTIVSIATSGLDFQPTRIVSTKSETKQTKEKRTQ